MRTVLLVLIFIASAIVSFLTCFGIYKLAVFMRSKNVKIPKTLKRILFVLLGIVVAIFVGYFIFTATRI